MDVIILDEFFKSFEFRCFYAILVKKVNNCKLNKVF